MDNLTTIISKNIINVDIDSRIVTLPVNFNLGVTYDNACKTVTFMVQKKSDITDLTDLTFSVNTISAKGTPDKIDCDCIEQGGFYIITAVLKGTIFEARGKAVFNLCGQKFDSSHVAVKAWGSEDITALVGSHSHAEKAIEELYPSVLEELRQKINNPNLTDEQLNNIATKVAEKGFYTKSEIDSMIADVDLSSYQTKTDDTLKDVTLYNSENPLDTHTTGGALRYMIKTLQTKYPKMNIIVLNVQKMTGWLDSEHTKSYDSKNQNEVINSVCEELCIPCIDMYHLLGLNDYTSSTILSDGLHRAHEGKLKQYKIIENQMNYYF